MNRPRARRPPPTASLVLHGHSLTMRGDAHALGEAIAGALMDVADRRTCRNCGCTDYEACEEGCEWVEGDLCSACVKPRARPAPAAKRQRRKR